VVIDSKFGSLWGEWCFNEPLGTYGVGLRNYMRRGWEKFSSHAKFEMGDSFKVSFWHDLCCGNMALKGAFPDLFGIVCAKDVFVAAHLKFSSASTQWNVSLVRSAHDWEVDVIASFFKV
jgi:hypothetical protein